MSIFDSLYTGWSGINAFSSDIQILSNNIVNVNTPGFKASQGQFQDLIYQNMVGASPVTGGQVGVGTRLVGVAGVFTQGGLRSSGIPTDLAINGDGFFIVRDTGADEADSLYYTRGGQFTMDGDGYLVTPDGFRLQGRLADNEGVITLGRDDILMKDLESPPIVTSSLTLTANLDPNVDIKEFDVEDPFSTCNYSTDIEVYDSQGNAHTLYIFFNKEDDPLDNNWQMRILAKSDEIETPGTGEYTDLTDLVHGYDDVDRRISFDEDGLLDLLPEFTTTDLTIDWNGIGEVDDGSILFDLGSIGSAEGMTQYGEEGWVLRTLDQDGRGAGVLTDFTIDQTGTIYGTFSNGEYRAVAQVLLANFANESALTRLGSNLYQSTAASGDPMEDVPGASSFGSTHQAFLETSNVDIGVEFIRLITSQRGFQVSSKIIQTMDQILGEVVNLKR